MRIRLGLAVLLGLSVLAIVAGWFVYDRQLSAPVTPRPFADGGGAFSGGLGSGMAPGSAHDVTMSGGPAGGVYFEVRSGESFRAVAARLARAGWVPSSWPLRLEARMRGWHRRVLPGWYAARPGDTVRSLLERLASGEIEQTRVTLPEGWRLDKILATLSDSIWVPLDSMRAAAGDPDWLTAQQVPGPGLEGYLFPDTYVLPRGLAPRPLLEQLLKPGLALWRDSLETEASARGLDRRQLWTLASIIEAEAAVSDERARISAVFWNRLGRGMRLESDPTVLFAHGRPPGRLLYVDLDIESPYNTYRNTGLPPGPICSPGRASLLAAVRPEPGCRDLFFVARGDGSHVFSRSLDEHNRARRMISLQKRRNAAIPRGKD